jgi:hypothetical protein
MNSSNALGTSVSSSLVEDWSSGMHWSSSDGDRLAVWANGEIMNVKDYLYKQLN